MGNYYLLWAGPILAGPDADFKAREFGTYAYNTLQYTGVISSVLVRQYFIQVAKYMVEIIYLLMQFWYILWNSCEIETYYLLNWLV